MKYTSAFRGVHWDEPRQEWIAQIRSIGFKRRFPTEMEALAHYMAASKLAWPDENTQAHLEAVNNVWDGRPNPPRAWNELGQRLIDIDHHFATIVDDRPTDPKSPYLLYKDQYWFVRDRHVLRVCWTGFIGDTRRVDFRYLPLAYYIFGGPCRHLNGDTLDNRRINLTNEPEPKVGKSHTPLSPEGLREFRSRPRPTLQQRFAEAQSEWGRYRQVMAEDGGTTWLGEIPLDPLTMPEFAPIWNKPRTV
jgi:hypothetical protein